jgi:hypothetical protein
MFLSKRYTLDPPLLGMTDEEAHTYIASDQPYYYRISADDIVQHIRKSRIRWGFEVELKLIDYDDRSHSVRFPLPSSIVKDIESFLTFNEYIDLFGEKKPKNV